MLNLYIRMICFKTRDDFMKGLDNYCRFLFNIDNYVIDFNTTKVILTPYQG
jgi:hypothetical protein